jgi:hypothetical protein
MRAAQVGAYGVTRPYNKTNRKGDIAPMTRPHLLLAGIDNLNFSFDAEVSDAIWQRLKEEQDTARLLAMGKNSIAHCPEWLDAQIYATGARGGYKFLIDKGDQFSIKLLRGVTNRPPIFVEMHAYGLHTHPDGVLGALYAACGYLHETLFPEMSADEAMKTFTLDTAKCSRLDLHADWQGGDVPQFGDTDERQFIHPGRVKVGRMSEGWHCTGYTFGRSYLKARLYNKTIQTKEAKIEWYHELLRQLHGDGYQPDLDVWRLEFQLMREGVKGFRLYGAPEDTDDDDIIEAELAAEELPTVSSVREALRWANEMWAYLTQRWLRWAVPMEDLNRGRWPLRDSWQVLQSAFKDVHFEGILPDEQLQLVRAQRHTGYARGMHRMAMGLLTALECVDIAPSAAQATYLHYLHRMAHLARQAQDKLWAQCEDDEQRALRVLRGMGVRDDQLPACVQLLDMALGVFTSAGVVTLQGLDDYRAVEDVMADMLTDLEAMAQEKGGVSQLLTDKWQKRFKLAIAHKLYEHSKVSA